MEGPPNAGKQCHARTRSALWSTKEMARSAWSSSDGSRIPARRWHKPSQKSAEGSSRSDTGLTRFHEAPIHQLSRATPDSASRCIAIPSPRHRQVMGLVAGVWRQSIVWRKRSTRSRNGSGSSTCGRWLDSSKIVHSAPGMRSWICPTMSGVASS